MDRHLKDNRRGLVHTMVSLAMLAMAFPAFAADIDVAKWDPRMAADNAVVDTDGIKWIDGRYLPLEGKAFADVEDFYDRLPAHVTTNVNEGVRRLKRHTSGMIFRFRTDSKSLVFRWTSLNPGWHMANMCDVGANGIDVYKRIGTNAWRFVASSHPSAATESKGERMKRISWRPGDECLVNLPLYNGIVKFAVGIDAGAKVEPARPHVVSKPVVFYGTSITHGGCCTRPGLGFVNWVGRDLDVPVVGLGFSGSGVMELEMSEHLARIDASCYVLDCLWNMALNENQGPGRSVRGNYEKFIRNLRKKRPAVPIIMAEQCDVYNVDPSAKDKCVRLIYEKLVSEGWKDLVYLPKTEMLGRDGEGTVDGCHPNDLGMRMMKDAFGKAVKEALKLDKHHKGDL